MKKHIQFNPTVLIIATGFIFAIIAFISTMVKVSATARTKESFSPGEYPKNVEEPLLPPEYQKKSINYGVVFRENDAPHNSALYPVAEHGPLQATNNVKHWATPDNGSCSPASFCGALYEPRAVPSDAPIVPISFSDPHKRVGFYASF